MLAIIPEIFPTQPRGSYGNSMGNSWVVGFPCGLNSDIRFSLIAGGKVKTGRFFEVKEWLGEEYRDVV